MTATYADLSPKSRRSIDTLTLHLLSLPIPSEREQQLAQFEAMIIEGYREGEGLSQQAATAMGRQWISILRQRVALSESVATLRCSGEPPNG